MQEDKLCEFIMKKTNENPFLNPYQIFWGIVTLETSLSKPAAQKIMRAAKCTIIDNANHFVFHAPAHLIDERMQSTLSVLATSGVHGKMYKITDKQYGMTINKWNGEVPECPAPFTHPVVVKDRKAVSLFPMSKEQYENAMEF